MDKQLLKKVIREEIQSLLEQKKLTDLKLGEKFFYNDDVYQFIELGKSPNTAKVKLPNGDTSVVSFGGGIVNKKSKAGLGAYLKAGGREWD